MNYLQLLNELVLFKKAYAPPRTLDTPQNILPFLNKTLLTKKISDVQEPEDGKIKYPLSFNKIYGKGLNAIVFHVVDGHGRDFALKLSIVKEDLRVHNTLARYDMAPKIYSIFQSSNADQVVIMDPITNVLCDMFKKRQPSYLNEAFECLLDKKAVLSFLHGDMHCGNIVILKDQKTLGFIDFDFSVLGVSLQENLLDFIPLIGSLDEIRGAKKLVIFLLDYYRRKFNINIDPAKITTPSIGGYFYKTNRGEIHSYITMRPNTTTVDKVFQSLILPEIVD